MITASQNSSLAMSIAAPARPPNPNTASTDAMTANIIAYLITFGFRSLSTRSLHKNRSRTRNFIFFTEVSRRLTLGLERLVVLGLD